MRRVAVAVAALALAVFAIGVGVLPLQSPAFTRALAARYSLAEEAGLPRERMLEIAETVRSFVVSGEGDLPLTVDGRAGFDAAAVSHLADVARVLVAARVAVLALGFALGLAGVLAWRAGRRREVLDALGVGAVATFVLPLFAGLVAVLDFDAFFAAFHGLFFANGTWTFPYDSLLIQTFPEPFWVTGGLSWALLTGAVAAGYGVAWAVGRRRTG